MIIEIRVSKEFPTSGYSVPAGFTATEIKKALILIDGPPEVVDDIRSALRERGYVLT